MSRIGGVDTGCTSSTWSWFETASPLVRGLKKFRGSASVPGTLKTLDKASELVNQVDGNLRARQAQNNRKQIHNNPSNGERIARAR